MPGGHDTDGDPIYVGRAQHNGEMLPAKVIPNKKSAYVSANCLEHPKQDVEVLTQYPGQYGNIILPKISFFLSILFLYNNFCLLGWVESSSGAVPPHAVSSGQTSDGEPLFVGRGCWAGSLSIGKVHPSHGCLYIPYGGAEYRLENYEVLVQQELWMPGINVHTLLVPGTVHAGRDIDGSDIYVGRARHDEAGGFLPAKVIPNRSCAYVSYGGREHMKDEYDLLVGINYSWVSCEGGSITEGAVACGTTQDGETLYIGRGHWGGSLMPGKVHQSQGLLYIPFGGAEVSLNNYEVLVRL